MSCQDVCLYEDAEMRNLAEALGAVAAGPAGAGAQTTMHGPNLVPENRILFPTASMHSLAKKFQ